jgi:hypothetical protein
MSSAPRRNQKQVTHRRYAHRNHALASGLSDGAAVFVLIVSNYVNSDTLETYVSMPYIAAEMRRSPRQVWRYKREAVASGWMLSEGDDGKEHTWRLTVPDGVPFTGRPLTGGLTGPLTELATNMSGVGGESPQVNGQTADGVTRPTQCSAPIAAPPGKVLSSLIGGSARKLPTPIPTGCCNSDN